MKKELFLPLIIFALTLVFAVICLMVYLSKGNAYWIKRKLKIGALLLTFNGIVYGTYGQTEVVDCYLMPAPPKSKHWLGITAGIDAVTHDSPQLNTKEISDFHLQNAYGNGFFAGFTYEYQFGHPSSSLSSVVVNLKYITKPGKTELSLIKQMNNPLPSIQLPEFLSVEAEYEFSFINTEILYKQNFHKEIPLGLVFGTYFSFPLKLKAKETAIRTIKIYPNEKVLYDGEIIDGNSIDFGIIAGVQWELDITGGFVITPNISYHYPLTAIQNSGWRIHTIDFELSFRYRL